MNRYRKKILPDFTLRVEKAAFPSREQRKSQTIESWRDLFI